MPTPFSSPRQRLRSLLLLASLSLPTPTGCTPPAPAITPGVSRSPAPAEPGPASAASPAPDDADPGRAATLQAAFRLTTVMAAGLRVAGVLWVQTHASCPSARELIDSGRLSPSLRADDPYGRPFKITCGAADATVRSAGPDGAFDTGDDIVQGPAELP